MPGLNPRNLSVIPHRPFSWPTFFALGVCFTAHFYYKRYLMYMGEWKMVGYRDKSAMFGKELAPGEEPSWGPVEGKWPGYNRLQLYDNSIMDKIKIFFEPRRTGI